MPIMFSLLYLEYEHWFFREMKMGKIFKTTVNILCTFDYYLILQMSKINALSAFSYNTQ